VPTVKPTPTPTPRPKTYKITWKLNKGKLKKKPARYTYGKGLVLKKPTRKGYKFIGWYTSKRSEKRIQRIGKKRKGKITLYAKWKRLRR